MTASSTSVSKVYRSVIDDVISNMREAFLDEGVDEQVLIELKQMWENKLVQSKAVDSGEPKPDPPAPAQRTTQATTEPARNVGTTQANNVTQPVGNTGMMQPTVLQYAPQAGSNDNQKTLTLSMPPHGMNVTNGPQKVTITLPAHMGHPGHTTVMSAPGATAALALPPEIAASLLQQPNTLAALNQGIFAARQPQNIPVPNDNQRIQYQTIAVSQPNTTSATPVGVTTSQPVQQISIATSQQNQQNVNPIVQLDGAHDTSDEEEDDFNEEDQNDDGDDDQNDEENEEEGEEEEPLNSEDDVSDEDPTDLFDTDNVVVCQYDKITRCRNKWKFHLKDGIMSLKGKDYVFHKSVGDAEW